MQIKVIRTSDGLDSLAEEWNHLLESSASHVPFLRHEYLSTWWRTLGGGEWTSGDLYIVTAHQDDGALCGIAPLFFTQNLAGEPALMLIGSIEISDYLDLIVKPEELSSFVDLLLDHLSKQDAPEWQVLDLYNLLEDSPTLEALKSAAEARGWTFSQERLQTCPYIVLPGDWEEYLAGIDKKQRHEIRRKLRRAEDADQSVRWYIVDDEEKLDDEVDAFLRLMGQDSEKQSFLTDVMRTQMRAAVRAAFRANWLQLAFLEIDGEKAAGYLNFDYGNHIWVYNSGLDYDFGYYSPGWVLLANLLQWAIEHGRTSFDFMRGDEDYKYRFGAVDRYVYRVRVSR